MTVSLTKGVSEKVKQQSAEWKKNRKTSEICQEGKVRREKTFEMKIEKNPSTYTKKVMNEENDKPLPLKKGKEETETKKENQTSRLDLETLSTNTNMVFHSN